MNKRQIKKQYPKSCEECSVMTMIKENNLITNNACGKCIHRSVADNITESNRKIRGVISV